MKLCVCPNQIFVLCLKAYEFDSAKYFLCSSYDVHKMNAHTLIVLVHAVQPENVCMDFDEIWYRHYAI